MSTARGLVNQRERDRGKKYTPKQKKFLVNLVNQDMKDPKRAAQDAGYGKNYWSVISALKEDMKEIAESMLIGASPEAALTITDILTSPTPLPGAGTKLAAAREILDRTGIVKPDKHQHEHKVSGGIFLMPVKHTIHEEAIDAEYAEVEDDE